MKNPTTDIRSVKLELLRAGPTHNQLLSPLTNYIALCGSDGPVTLNIPFEHRQLLMRLKRLKYPLDVDPATDSQRQSELRELGESIGSIFAKIPALISEIGRAATEKGSLVHLSLSMSAFELGLLPFEATIAADGFPGTGAPLFLQTRTPISITREVRRGRPLPLEWDRTPKILFAFAAPADSYVPAQSHLHALREAIEPWIKIKDNAAERIAEVKKILTVLPNASLEQLRNLCAKEEFTHVHILAHGAIYQHSGEERYGVALCNDAEPNQADIVDGERLALALTSTDSAGGLNRRPSVVTLATCDSGNINSVIAPGGSIAHELNNAGIPWVIASQFPLWMKASAIAAKVLYSGLLLGDDPRWVIHELRQRLRTDAPETHDWASIVTYSTTPPDFIEQVQKFRSKQTKRRIEIYFDRIDELVKLITTERNEPSHPDELLSLAGKIRTELADWRNDVHSETSKNERSMRLGLSAASEKRIGIAMNLIKREEDAKQAYKNCFEFYKTAWTQDQCNYWLLTQYLSIIAICNQGKDEASSKRLRKKYSSIWKSAIEITKWKLINSSNEEQAYIYATLAELTLLSVIYDLDDAKNLDKKKSDLIEDIQEYCQKMLNENLSNKFPIFSTKRQFYRYLKEWENPLWKELAQAAIDKLEEDF